MAWPSDAAKKAACMVIELARLSIVQSQRNSMLGHHYGEEESCIDALNRLDLGKYHQAKLPAMNLE